MTLSIVSVKPGIKPLATFITPDFMPSGAADKPDVIAPSPSSADFNLSKLALPNRNR